LRILETSKLWTLTCLSRTFYEYDTLYTVLPSQICSMHLSGTHRLIRTFHVGQLRNSVVSDCLLPAQATMHCPGFAAYKQQPTNNSSSVRLKSYFLINASDFRKTAFSFWKFTSLCSLVLLEDQHVNEYDYVSLVE